MLTNALIKLSPPCIRQNEGVFFHRKHPGGAEPGKAVCWSWRAPRGQEERQLSQEQRTPHDTQVTPSCLCRAPILNINPQPGSEDVPHPGNAHGSASLLPATALAPAQHCCFLCLFPPAPKPPLRVGQGLCNPWMCHSEKDVFPGENLNQHSTFTLTSITSKLPTLQASIRSTGVKAES